MSRPDLAKASGVPYPTLSGLESGDQASSTAVPALAAALGVNPLWLQTGKQPKSAVPPASQSTGLDPEKLNTAIKFVDDLEAASRKELDRSRRVAMITAVYAELLETSEPNLVEMGIRLSRKAEEDDERQRKAGGTGANDRAGAGKSTRKTKAASGRT